MRDYYDILGVSSDCGFAELKRAFYAAAKHCHPDRFGNSPDKTVEFQVLAEAFGTLSDPDLRREYDAGRLDTLHRMAVEAVHLKSGCILDCEASDILEELIVGNDAPPETSLATLLADLEKTDVFMSYREGRNAAALGKNREAAGAFLYAVGRAPANIVFRVHLARALRDSGQYRKARYHYNCAIAIGERRVPRQSMLNVKFELAEMKKRARPWLWRILGIGDAPERPQWSADAADEMLSELGRCMSRAARRELEKDSGTPKKLDK